MHQLPAARRTKKTLVHHVYTADCQLAIPASAFTLEGFRAWGHSPSFPDKGQICYLKGELFINMSPESIPRHNLVKTEVGRVISHLTARLRLGRFFSDRTWLTNTDAEISTEPDALFARWAT